MPKSLNVTKALKAAGVENPPEGLGTALKPAWEPIVVARKPLSGTVAATVLQYGTGALNIDATRVEAKGERFGGGAAGSSGFVDGYAKGSGFVTSSAGRWPTNVLLDGDAADELDEQSGVLTSGKQLSTHKRSKQRMGASGIYGASADPTEDALTETYGDSGGASRFFPTFRYQAKAPTRERVSYVKEGAVDAGNTEGGARPEHFRCLACGRTKSGRNSTAGACECAEPQWERRGEGKVAHPTVKPLALMRWLVRLVTPPGGVVLDPFAGSGTTIEAAILEGFQVIGIEREADYLPLIEARIARNRITAEGLPEVAEALALFDFEEPA